MSVSLSCQEALFSIPSDVTYLNSAYMGPLPLPVQNAAHQAVDWRAQPWQISASDFFTHADRARSLAAQMLNAPSESVAIIPSTAWAVAIVAHHLKPQAGQNVVVLDEQFPSNMHPWRKWRAQRVELRVVKAPQGALDQRSKNWSDALLAAIDENTALVAIEQAHWTDGTLFNLEAIGTKARSVGALYLVDVTQTIGAYPIDAQKIGADALIAHCYKSMLSHYGLGFAAFSPRLLQAEPFEQSWLLRKNAEDFSRLIDYQDEYAPGARRFDTSSRANPVLIHSLIASLELMLSWGAERITKYLRDLRPAFDQKVREAGFQIAPIDHTPGNIFGIHIGRSVDLEAIRRTLADRQIWVSVRGSAIRVSPHVYNDTNDLIRLGEVLANFSQT